MEPTQLPLAVLGATKSRHSKEFHREKYIFHAVLLFDRRQDLKAS